MDRQIRKRKNNPPATYTKVFYHFYGMLHYSSHVKYTLTIVIMLQKSSMPKTMVLLCQCIIHIPKSTQSQILSRNFHTLWHTLKWFKLNSEKSE